MFAIATPQTVELLATDPVDPAVPVDPKARPKEPVSHGTATFSHPTDDVSETLLTITSKDKTWTFLFNTGGTLISSSYEDDAHRKMKAQVEKRAKEAAAKEQARQQEEAKKAAAELAKENAADAAVKANPPPHGEAWDGNDPKLQPSAPAGVAPAPHDPFAQMRNL